MRKLMDERVKHRLVGLVVILSLAVIFAPAMIKKSSQRLDNSMGMRSKLPDKPIEPRVAVTDKQSVFQTIKVAHVTLPPPSSHKIEKTVQQPAPVLAKVTVPETTIVPVKLPSSLVTIPPPAAAELAFKAPVKKPPVVKIKAKAKAKASAVLKLTKKPLSPESSYTVQLASFTKQQNAQVLINTLQKKGYKALVTKLAQKQGKIYKVTVGQALAKKDALRLQNKLATNLQLKGFIVSGVG